MQADLPVSRITPVITVRAVAVVLHFLIKPHPFSRSHGGTPVFFRSVSQSLHLGLVHVNPGGAEEVSVGDQAGAPWKAPTMKQGAIGPPMVGGRRYPTRVIAFHGGQPWWWCWGVRLSQDCEHS